MTKRQSIDEINEIIYDLKIPIEVTEKEHRIVIKDSFMKLQVLMHLLILITFIINTPRAYDDLNIFYIIGAYTFLLISLWVETSNFNNISIDPVVKKFRIIPKNFLLSLWMIASKQKMEHNFTDLHRIETESNDSFKRIDRKYYIVFVFKNGLKKKILYLRKPKQAFIIRDFLNSCIIM